MNNTIFFLLLLVVSVYIVIRQFVEQRVTPVTLLLLPLLSVYASYIDLRLAFTRFPPLPLLGGLAFGIIVGLLTGIFRGRHTRVRLDNTSGTVYSKPQIPSSIMWLALLLVRIGVLVLTYSSLNDNLLVGVIIAFGGTVFLFSITTQKFIVFTRSNRCKKEHAGFIPLRAS